MTGPTTSAPSFTGELDFKGGANFTNETSFVDDSIFPDHAAFPQSSTPVIFTVLIAIAYYNIAELHIIILRKFRPLRGLYFWSFLAATWGIFFYLFSIILNVYYVTTEGLLIATFLVVGWIPMVTGEALVLYSRLHFVLQNKLVLKIMFGIILLNGTVVFIPIVAMVYGASLTSSPSWIRSLLWYEKAQVTSAFLQSTAMSGIYIFQAGTMLRRGLNIQGTATRHILMKVIGMNVVYILLGITIVAFEWWTTSILSPIYRAAVYSVKLKLEYEVLNQLPEIETPPNPSEISDIEKQYSEGEDRNLEEQQGTQIVSPQKANVRTQIIDPSRLSVYMTNARLRYSPNSNYPAGEALRSKLNDAVIVSPRGRTLSAIQHWADEVSDDDDIESFYSRSRKRESEAGMGLTPSPKVTRAAAAASHS